MSKDRTVSPTTRVTLLQRLRTGTDEEAWRQFVDLYGPLAYRLGRKHGLDEGDCDVLVQDFCVRALSALPRFDYRPERGRFRSWVLTVALNELRMRKRSDAARQRAMDGYRQEILEQEEAVDDELERWWETEEQRRILEVALARLRAGTSPEKFAVFHLATVRGVPIGEVADFYGLTKPQVSLTKFRMLQRLRGIAKEIEEAWHER